MPGSVKTSPIQGSSSVTGIGQKIIQKSATSYIRQYSALAGQFGNKAILGQVTGKDGNSGSKERVREHSNGKGGKGRFSFVETAEKKKSPRPQMAQKVYDTVDFKLPSTIPSSPTDGLPINKTIQFEQDTCIINVKKKKRELEVEKLILYIKDCIIYIYIYIF